MPTPEDRSSPAAPGSLLATLGWAAYLACSWTWCIGMFLPVLLIRDFGIWGFIVFAVPNVIGAAAMGWVLKSRDQSAECENRHRNACRAFSWITVAFQAFFLLWLSKSADTAAHFALGGTLLLVLLVIPIWRCHASAPFVTAALPVWIISLAAGVVILLLRVSRDAKPLEPALAQDIVWLAPVCCFGFLLCPYLDLTFHHARQNLLPRPARAAFSLGFGVMFAAMIGMTWLYAPTFIESAPAISFLPVSRVLFVVLLTHLTLQLLYTVTVHLHRMRNAPRPVEPTPGDWIVPLLIALLIGGVSAALSFPPYRGLSPGEITYRLFMSFYGLVFPAYVWLCMIPTRNESGTQPPSRAKLVILFTSIALAAPFYWMGFIERQTWYLAPGLAIVLFARLLLPRSTAPPQLTV